MVVAASHRWSHRKVSPLSAHSCTRAGRAPPRTCQPPSPSGSGPTAVPGPPPRRRAPVLPIPCSPCRGGRRASEPAHQAETLKPTQSPATCSQPSPDSEHSACHHLLPRPVPTTRLQRGTFPPGHCQAGRREMWRARLSSCPSWPLQEAGRQSWRRRRGEVKAGGPRGPACCALGGLRRTLQEPGKRSRVLGGQSHFLR